MKIAIVNHKNLSRARNGAVPASDNTTPKDETPIAELLKEAFAEFDQEDIEKQIQEIRKRNQTKKKGLRFMEFAAAASFVGLCCSLMLFEPEREGRVFTQFFKSDLKNSSNLHQSNSQRQCFPLFEYSDFATNSNGTYCDIYQYEYLSSETHEEKMSSKNAKDTTSKKSCEQKVIEPLASFEIQSQSLAFSLYPPIIEFPTVMEGRCADNFDLNSNWTDGNVLSCWVNFDLNEGYDLVDEFDFINNDSINSSKETYSNEYAFCRTFTIHDIRKRKLQVNPVVLLVMSDLSNSHKIKHDSNLLNSTRLAYLTLLKCYGNDVGKPARLIELSSCSVGDQGMSKFNFIAVNQINQRGLYESNRIRMPWVLLGEADPNLPKKQQVEQDSERIERFIECLEKGLSRHQLLSLHINQIGAVLSK